jgi:hypothetical protein
MYNEFPTNYTNFPSILEKFAKLKKKKVPLALLAPILMFAKESFFFLFFAQYICIQRF